MSSQPYYDKSHLNILICFLVIYLIGILVFGLNPKSLSTTNHVSRVPGAAGIKFGKQGIAYTDPFLKLTKIDAYTPVGLSLEISLQPEFTKKGGFNFILAFHGGKDEDQLLVGQWRNHIIVMNGNDYSNRRRMKRITFNAASIPSKKFLFTVTTGEEGTKIYINGQLLHEKKDLILKLPDNNTNCLLTIGNSVYGRNSWSGTIYGLAFYRHELTKQSVSLHYDDWLRTKNFLFAKKDSPHLLYLFNEDDRSRVLDHSGQNNHVYIPEKMKWLKKKFLHLSNENGLSSWMDQDGMLNLVGFIPLGFILSAILTRSQGIIRKHYILIAISIGFLTSLSIEVIQSWIPTRSSDISDLILNTFGAMIGAIIYAFLLHYKKLGSSPN